MRTKFPKLTDRLRLGRSQLEVSPFCLGMSRSADAITAAYDAGINFFFITADMHWPLYEQTRRGLAKLLRRGGDVRSRIVVAGVIYVTQPEFCWDPFAELVDAVDGLEHLDLLIAGACYADNFAARLPVLGEHRQRRFLGAQAIGATFHDRALVADAVNAGEIDIAFVRFNAAHRGAQTEVFPLINTGERSTLLFNFKNVLKTTTEAMRSHGLSDEYWAPNPGHHYRFVIGQPEVDGILCGLGSPQEVAELDKALEEGPLDEDEEEYVIAVSELCTGAARLKDGFADNHSEPNER